LVDAVRDAVRSPHSEHGEIQTLRLHNSGNTNGCAARRPRLDPERLAKRVERAGYSSRESSLVALAALTTVGSPLSDADVDWISSTAARIGNEDLLLETAGVIFAFNTVNRVADARRVRLEFRFLRELKPIRGWVERRFASLIGLAYDLSFKYQPRRSPAELLDRVGVVFEQLGATDVPDVFNWLSRSPVVLEGILAMIEANITGAGVRFDLLKEAVAIAVASRAMSGSSLSRVVDQSRLGVDADSSLMSACRRYSSQVGTAAYKISDEQIREIAALGLSDAELLDLTLATSVFSALAIIEPIGAAVALPSSAVG